MKNAIKYTAFSQKDEKNAMNTLMELRGKMKELYNNTGFESVYQDMQTINKAIEILNIYGE